MGPGSKLRRYHDLWSDPTPPCLVAGGPLCRPASLLAPCLLFFAARRSPIAASRACPTRAPASPRAPVAAATMLPPLLWATTTIGARQYHLGHVLTLPGPPLPATRAAAVAVADTAKMCTSSVKTGKTDPPSTTTNVYLYYHLRNRQDYFKFDYTEPPSTLRIRQGRRRRCPSEPLPSPKMSNEPLPSPKIPSTTTSTTTVYHYFHYRC